MKDTKDMSDEELSEVLASMGITVTDETINGIREQERAEQENVNEVAFELDGPALLMSDGWVHEFETVQRQLDEDKQLEASNLAVPSQPPTWIIEDYINSARARPVRERRVYRELCGSPKCVSRADLSALSPILLDEMQVGKRQYGRVLFCRTTTLPLVTDAIRLVVLDMASSGAILELYHHPILPASLGKPTRQDYDDAFELQTILAIKEPRLTLNSTLMTVKIESLRDVCVLEDGDDSLKGLTWVGKDGKDVERVSDGLTEAKDVRHLRDQVKQLSTVRRYLKIERLLTRAIGIHQGERLSLVDLLLDRARNRLLLERYDEALSDTIKVEEILAMQQACQRHDLKRQLQDCITLRASCLYSLRRWQEAQRAYRQASGANPLSMDDPTQKGLERCRRRIQEQETGNYDDVGLFRQVQRDGLRRLDVADYMGPVEVAEYPGMGKGYRTTRHVKAGELLVVDKALARIQPENPKAEDDIRLVGFNMLNRSIEAAGSHALRMELSYKASHQSNVQRGLRMLYAGDRSERFWEAEETKGSTYSSHAVDAQHIDGAVTYNLFGPRDLEFAAFAGRSGAEDGNQALALYQHASIFNHCCLNNAYWTSLGDVLFVRAIQDVPAHTQVFINYCANAEYLDRRNTLTRFLGEAGCSCGLCRDDRDDGRAAMVLRKNVMDTRLRRYYGEQALDGTASVGALEARISKIKDDIAKIVASYSGRRRSHLRPALFRLHLDLALHLGHLARRKGRQPPDSAQDIIAQHRLALGSVGVVIDPGLSDPIVSLPMAFQQEAIMSVIQIAATFQALGEAGDASRWLVAAKAMHKKLVSRSNDLFDDRYAEILDMMGLRERTL